MESTLLFLVKGPLFRFSLAIMALGLARIILIALTAMVQAYRRAGNHNIDLARIIKQTAAGIIPPFSKLSHPGLYSIASYLFHVGLVIVPLFLHGHIQLWKKGIGISWPALPPTWADGLSLLVIFTGIGLLGGRLASIHLRRLSSLQDYFILLLILGTFLTGILVAHPNWNPFPYQATLITHALSGDFLLVLVPFSKLAHIILWPIRNLATELAWHFPPQAGAKILSTLGKEDKV